MSLEGTQVLDSEALLGEQTESSLNTSHIECISLLLAYINFEVNFIQNEAQVQRVYVLCVLVSFPSLSAGRHHV